MIMFERCLALDLYTPRLSSNYRTTLIEEPTRIIFCSIYKPFVIMYLCRLKSCGDIMHVTANRSSFRFT